MLNRPIVFTPYYKSVIWGGDKIAQFKGTTIDRDDIGESWEISAVPGSESVVEGDGPLAGKSIVDLIEEYGEEFLGTDVMVSCGKKFPLLIKFIDARQNLSVQVHPNDELAQQRHGCNGKTEMWYIIDAEKDANIYTGLRAPLDPEQYQKRIADDTIMDVVGVHHSEAHQFYFVPAGTIHAIGAGNLLAEVQQSSDITYRVYDYNRRDANGNPRQLHVEEAKEAIDYTYPNDIKPTAKKYERTTKGAVSCQYFDVDFISQTECETEDYDTQGKSFAIIIVGEGCLRVALNDGATFDYLKGTTILMPAKIGPFKITGKHKSLLVTYK